MILKKFRGVQNIHGNLQVPSILLKKLSKHILFLFVYFFPYFHFSHYIYFVFPIFLQSDRPLQESSSDLDEHFDEDSTDMPVVSVLMNSYREKEAAHTSEPEM